MHNSHHTYAKIAIMDLRRIHHLLLLAEELSFSRAAERVNLSQTAFSRSIQSLEAEFGVRFFDRDTRTVQLTQVGSRLVERGKKLLAEAADITREISLAGTGEAGDLTFGVSGMAMNSELQKKIVRLYREHPKLCLNVEIGDWKSLREQLDEEKIEFFVAYPGDLGKNSKYKVTPLPGRRTSSFCRAGHPLLKNTKSLSLTDYLSYPWAAVQMDEEFKALFRQACKIDSRIDLPYTLKCSNTELLRLAILNSDALLFTWHDWLMEDLRSGAIVDLGAMLKTKSPLDSRVLNCGLVQLSRRTCSPAAQMAIAEFSAFG
jgi:DNA-binding transcriptional LysR family regulator